MAKELLHYSSLPLFLKELATYGDVHGPVMTDDNVPSFGRIDSPAKLRLDARRTLIPPKKYLMPPRDAVLTYSPDRGYRQPAISERKIILFGLHPCDLAGISYLDKVFTAIEPDPLYHERRRNLILIGLSCEPDDYCFCGDVGTSESSLFDLFLHCTDEGYRLAVGSPLGEQIISGISMLLSECKPLAYSRQACTIERKILDAAACDETFPDSPLWDDFAARCLSCGACSLCCPTCYCFDVREYGCLGGVTAERLREWDNCLFADHGMIAGGINFRKNRRERLIYRYQHKYLGFGPVRGIVACVGCGRCRLVCPVGIDLLNFFREGLHEKPS